MTFNHFALFLLLILAPGNVESAYLHWIGGNGLWHNTDNWSLTPDGASCNCIPTASDDVNIRGTSATCTIGSNSTAYAASIHVDPFTKLVVGNGLSDTRSKLVVTNSIGGPEYGCEVSGSLIVVDTLEISNFHTCLFIQDDGEFIVEGTGNTKLSNNTVGLFNQGVIKVRQNGFSSGELIVKNNKNIAVLSAGSSAQMIIDGILVINDFSEPISSSLSGLGCFTSSSFKINSTGILAIDMSLRNAKKTGVLSYSSSFLNEGTIVIEGTNTAGIVNEEQGSLHFINRGNITIYNFARDGITSNALFENWGILDIRNNLPTSTATALKNSGQFKIASGSKLLISQLCNEKSIAIHNTGDFSNNGVMLLFNLDSIHGICNDGTDAKFHNNKLLKIGAGAIIAIENKDGAYFKNDNSIAIHGNYFHGILNSMAIFDNHGGILINKNLNSNSIGIGVYNGGTINNYQNSSISLSNLIGSYGINIHPSGKVFNQGILTISNSSFTNAYFSAGKLQVDTGAELTIEGPYDIRASGSEE